ncbi:MAG TPA: ABC transporter permease [Streptosporangiaceae bacterium]
MVLLRYVLDNPPLLNRVGPEFIGIFPLIVMFLVTAITMQRERARGTLERLMATPLAKLDLLAGYAIAFGILACLQAGIVLAISLTWLGVTLPGSVVPLAVIAVLDAVLGMALGLFASAFARTEFQAVQFMPAFVLPQTLLCGIVVARDQMTPALRWLSDVLPLSYAVDAMQRISTGASWPSAVAGDTAVIAAFTACGLFGGALNGSTTDSCSTIPPSPECPRCQLPFSGTGAISCGCSSTSTAPGSHMKTRLRQPTGSGG